MVSVKFRTLKIAYIVNKYPQAKNFEFCDKKSSISPGRALRYSNYIPIGNDKSDKLDSPSVDFKLSFLIDKIFPDTIGCMYSEYICND